jgi:hypothetical protein
MSDDTGFLGIEDATTAKVREYAARLRALGIEPAVSVDISGRITVIRTAPRELREQFRQALAAFGIGVLADVAINGQKDADRVAAVRAMQDAGLGSARSAMDGEGNMAAAGLIMFPVPPSQPQPPRALLAGEASTGWVPADVGDAVPDGREDAADDEHRGRMGMDREG